tara:strand:- start:4103 stop:4357 length:255 start_codon:yes stop_codon:yes gene_type:complete
MLFRLIVYGALSLGVLGVGLHAMHQKKHWLLTEGYPPCRLTIPIQNGWISTTYLNDIMSDACCDGVMAIQWNNESDMLRVVHHE